MLVTSPEAAAERQARYRQRKADNRAAPALRPPRPTRHACRPQQWRAACGHALEATG